MFVGAVHCVICSSGSPCPLASIESTWRTIVASKAIIRRPGGSSNVFDSCSGDVRDCFLSSTLTSCCSWVVFPFITGVQGLRMF